MRKQRRADKRGHNKKTGHKIHWALHGGARAKTRTQSGYDQIIDDKRKRRSGSPGSAQHARASFGRIISAKLLT